ncbi:helix-turn-helix domain-containing protein [Sphingobacterium sp. ML3W]|uniref:helix-turn-helix domain-containing protein n=1 Tax=Sphingobacterium sp. ML3W TaxID=1538644 RepID=UPI00068D979B|nr:helix-turn-helix domain-containing protein [Sphingobacterium sp. ML3W]
MTSLIDTVLKIHRSEPKDIKKLLSLNEDYAVGFRLYLVYLISLGHSSRELAKFHDISFKEITNWVHRFEEEGISGLKSRKGRGRRSALSSDQLHRVRTLILEEKPEQYGFTNKRWTGPILAKWIKDEYGVEYQKAQLYRILANIGITFKGQLSLIENDESSYI